MFTARCQVNDALEMVVVKKLGAGYDEGEFVKEARMLNGVQHPNIVGFKGFCPNSMRYHVGVCLL